MALFRDFHNENLRLFSLNFGIITLIPKLSEATKIEQYRQWQIQDLKLGWAKS
jgi:hypothetical protein